MIVTFILLLMSGFTNGFLLDSRNTSSLLGKPTYLTTAEYYGDKNQIHHDLDKLHQDQETYRDQQERSLNLLTNQLQQKFDIIEQILAAQPSYNELNETKKTIDALEKKYKELEMKYNAVQAELIVKEKMYNSAVNKTLALAGKINKLEQLQNINQLQTLQTLQGQVQTFDSRINLLASHEQARNQDFLALYNLTTSSRHELENKMNTQFQTIEKNQNMSVAILQQRHNEEFRILRNLTSESRNENEKLANHTIKEINELANHTMTEIEQMGRYHNSSFSTFQQNLDKQLQKVVVTGCTSGNSIIPAGPLKFPVIKTSAGVSDLSSFQSTGKFTCQVPGYYHIVTTIMSGDNNVRIDIMKNLNSIHWQYVTKYITSYWKPGSAALALELKTNDTVWIKLQSSYQIYQSCLTIFKIN